MTIKNPTDRFDTFDEFIDCVRRGCEIEFEYGGQRYFVAHGNMLCIYKLINDTYSDMELFEYHDSKKIGAYMIKDKMLKDIVTDLNVLDRLF